jgi:hypothetical protein
MVAPYQGGFFMRGYCRSALMYKALTTIFQKASNIAAGYIAPQPILVTMNGVLRVH